MNNGGILQGSCNPENHEENELRLGICTTYCNNSLFNGPCFMLSGWDNGMVEYWNVDLNKEVTHLLAFLSRGILPILHLVREKFANSSVFPEPIIPWPRPDFFDLSTNACITEIIQWRSLITFLSRQGGPSLQYSNIPIVSEAN